MTHLEEHSQLNIGFHAQQTQIRKVPEGMTLIDLFKKQSNYYDALLGRHILCEGDALDLGCGWGNFSYYLKTRGFSHIVGVDFDPEQIALASKVGINELHCTDVFRYIEEDERYYDLISAIDLVEHLKREDVLQFLALCRRRIKTKGMLVMRMPSADSPFAMYSRYNDLAHEFCYSTNLIFQLLLLNGFEQVSFIEEFYGGPSRRMIARMARQILRNYLRVAGIRPPKILSENMWVVAQIRE